MGVGGLGMGEYSLNFGSIHFSFSVVKLKE